MRMSTQAAFAAALLDAERPCPEGLVAWNGSDPARRFAVYRNNVVSSLIEALADTFPVVRELVGDEFFRAMARVFVAKSPPRSPILAEYGEKFPAFIEDFPPAHSVPYLADVARLEMLYLTAYHAPDAKPLDQAGFHAALARADDLPKARVRLHPSAGILRSSHAVCSLWAAHQGTLDIGTVDPYRAEDALVVRPHWEVLVLPLRPGSGRFLDCLANCLPFGPSAQTASEENPGFDLAATLADLICAGAVVGLDFAQENPS
jgi:hypothetical protein